MTTYFKINITIIPENLCTWLNTRQILGNSQSIFIPDKNLLDAINFPSSFFCASKHTSILVMVRPNVVEYGLGQNIDNGAYYPMLKEWVDWHRISLDVMSNHNLGGDRLSTGY